MYEFLYEAKLLISVSGVYKGTKAKSATSQKEGNLSSLRPAATIE